MLHQSDNMRMTGRIFPDTKIAINLSIYDKLFFYSVISNYQTAYTLGLIKKTCTILETDLLAGHEKLSNVLSFDSGLFGKDV